MLSIFPLHASSAADAAVGVIVPRARFSDSYCELRLICHPAVSGPTQCAPPSGDRYRSDAGSDALYKPRSFVHLGGRQIPK